MADPNFTLHDAIYEAERAYVAANPRSEARWQEARALIPGGSTRTSLFYTPFPLTVRRAEGANLWDVDDHHYTDFLNDFTAGLFGHSDPVIRAAVKEALDDGVSLGANNVYETGLAATMCARFPSVELVRFTNSGTEGSLMSVLAARAFTGRTHVMVFEYGYHGGVFMFAPPHSELNVPLDYVMGHFNDAERTLATIEAHAEVLAAIVIEPVMGGGGCIPADREFLEALRAAATRHGIVLVFDEVMTSRLSPGGMQAALDILPDLTVFGKYVGGGMTFGAFGGRADIMGRFDLTREGAFQHAGTFNNNVLSMAAGLAGLSKVYTAEAAQTLNDRGEDLRTALNAAARERDLPFQVTGYGSMMNVHVRRAPITRPEDVASANKDALTLFHLEMLAQGQHLARRGFMSLSLALEQADLDRFVMAATEFLDNRAEVLDRAQSV